MKRSAGGGRPTADQGRERSKGESEPAFPEAPRQLSLFGDPAVDLNVSLGASEPTPSESPSAAAVVNLPAVVPAPQFPPPATRVARGRKARSERDRGLPRGASEVDGASLVALRQEYERHRATWGIGEAMIELSRRRLTGGVIRYGRPHRIVISLHMSVEERRETLLHEIAHAVCWTRDGDSREGHGARFWEVARSLGVRRRAAPETEALRTHREAKAVHLYRCEGCETDWRRFRPFRRAMLCASCHRKGRPARLRKVRLPAAKPPSPRP